jgi:VCBS repeat-containing protein
MEQDTPLNVLVSDGVLANDQDADGDAISAVLINLPVKGVLILNSDGSFTYTPEAGFTGTVTFTYRAYDGQMYSAATQVRITVTGTPASEPNHLYIPLFLGRL